MYRGTLKIGIDLLWLRPKKVGGTETYIRNLLKGLQTVDEENKYYLFISQSTKDSFDFVNSPNFHKIVCKVNNENRLLRIIYTNFVLPWKIRKLNLDIMFFPTYMRPFLKMREYSISNIHDLQYLHYPENFSYFRRLVFKIFYSVSIRKSDKIIAISNFVKQDIMMHFGKELSNLEYKINVIYNPIEFKNIQVEKYAEEVLAKWNLRKNEFIYTVSSMFPHKNLNTLVKAFAMLRVKNPGIKLVVSGISGPSRKEFTNILSDLSLADEVIITGYISDLERDTLYANCKCFVFPSVFEGFGMPPVEALWFGVPTIVSDIPVMREVTQNKAIYVSDYKNPDEWFKILADIFKGENRYIISERAKKELYEAFSIENIAREYLLLFKACKEEEMLWR